MRNTRNFTALGCALGSVALGAIGCGTDQKPLITGQGNALATPQQNAAATPAPASAAPAARSEAAPRIKPQSYPVAPLAQVETRALKHLHAFKAARDKQLTMRAREHARAVISTTRDLVDAVVIAAGLEFATFDVIDGGRTVSINVQPKDACVLSPADATAIQDRILDGSDIVDNVYLRLTTGGTVTGRYLKQHCHQTARAAGIGAILLKDTGDGITETKPFHVTNGNWSIDWTSYSDMLRIYVFRDGKLVSLAVDRQGRGSGRAKVLEAGYYTLRIAGTAAWSVKVRNGVPQQLPTVRPKAAPTTQP